MLLMPVILLRLNLRMQTSSVQHQNTVPWFLIRTCQQLMLINKQKMLFCEKRSLSLWKLS